MTMTTLDKSLEEYWKKFKLDGRSALFLEYTPIIGPIFTSGTALRALLDSFNNKNDQTSKIIRIKGLSTACSGLVDISLLCFAVIIMAFVGENLSRLTNNTLIYQATLSIIILNCLAVSVGAKLVSVQVIEFSTSQLEQVQTVGSSVVKSASITATAIEKIVTTTNHRSGLVIGAFDSFINRIVNFFLAILSFPNNVKLRIMFLISRIIKNFLQLFKIILGAFLLEKYKKN